MRSRLLIGFVLLLTAPAHAVRVALLEVHFRGQKIVLEPGGRFAHVAIEVEDGLWLHAHPYPGLDVELTRHLSRFGENMEVLDDPRAPRPTRAQVEHYLGLTYDRHLGWSPDDGTTYNARLVGELLGIAPRPAYYMAEIWADYAPRGAIGLSPDDIYHALKERGFRSVNCADSLAVTGAGRLN